MKSISSIVVASVLFAASSVFADPIPVAFPDPTVALKSMTTEGCYGSSTGLTFNSSWTYQTSGYCQGVCADGGFAVLATTNSQDCWCGNEMPPLADKADDDKCDDPCAGYDTEMCGSEDSTYFSVYLTGTKNKVDNAASDSSSSSSSSSSTSTTSSSPSVVTMEGQTIVVTATGQAASVSAEAAAKKHTNDTAGIAAGVVVGVVLIAAVAGGTFLFMRNRRKRAIEEEYRRNAQVSSFIGKSPGSAGGYSQDTRLDPVMAQRRMSDGSIADNQDYSRRILKVTNA